MIERKTNSLYGEIIKNSLQNEQQWLKSEDLPEYRRFYVNESLIETLHNNGNHLIVGRRGTGKTHLIGSFAEFIRDDCPEEMAIMISVMEALPKTPPSTVLETQEFTSNKMASLMYEGFLKVFFKRLLDQSTVKLEKLKIKKSKLEYKSLDNTVNNILTRLMEAIELGDTFYISKEAISKSEEEIEDNIGLGGNFEFGINKLIPNIDASLSLGGKGAKKRSSKLIKETKSVLYINLFNIRELTLELIKVLEINVLHILIDEWMELDKSSSSSIQPIFAQYLKTTFANEKHFSIKIATIWHETSLYDRDDMEKSKGMQLKHDIVRSVNLDTTFLISDDEVYTFAKNIIFKRLEYACSDLKILVDRDGEVSDIFITEIFDNKENFKAFITASHGIPRDLIDIFQKCSLKIKRNFDRKCICHDLVYEVSKNIYNTDKRPNIDPASTPQRLLSLINKYMAKTERRLFLVSNEQAVKSRSLRKLVDEELIHQVPSAVTPREIYDTHKAYLIDFGNFVDWVKSRNLDISTLVKESVIASFPTDFSTKIDEYMLDVESVIVNRIFCPNKLCSHIFLMEDPVFQKAGICPKCATDIQAYRVRS